MLSVGAVGIVVEDAHMEAVRPFGHGAADAAKADHAERVAGDVAAEQHERPPAVELAGAGEAVGLGDAAARRP